MSNLIGFGVREWVCLACAVQQRKGKESREAKKRRIFEFPHLKLGALPGVENPSAGRLPLDLESRARSPPGVGRVAACSAEEDEVQI